MAAQGVFSEPLPAAEEKKTGSKEKAIRVLVGPDLPTDNTVETQLNVTEADLAEAKALAGQMSTEEVRTLLTNVYRMHENDPNFPHTALQKIKEFVGSQHVFDQPEKHEDLIYEMKVEAALIMNNSPYAEVRAVVSNRDDPNTPCSTVRAWTIGIGFSIALAFINQLFSIRQPSITVLSNVAQLLSYPVGKLWEKTVPDWGFHLPATVFGHSVARTRISLNPGPFNKKEHMLITIMANVAFNTPYTNNIIWTQYLPVYFNQPFAGQFSYQILVGLSTNLIGYGLAGLSRRFLVYPAYCVWPTSLVTIALNEAFHSEQRGPVKTPFGSIWRATRMKFFLLSFSAMFVYFWFPNFLFQALSLFSWMTWISPNNVKLAALTGINNGLGFNPWPTFDWNIVTFNYDPLVVPFFTTLNNFLGLVVASFVVLAMWFTNAYYTSYLPINSNRVFDNTGKVYNISRIIDERSIFSEAKYVTYSPAYMAAGNLTIYIFFFAIYPATIVYIGLNHGYEFTTGMRNVYYNARDVVRPLFRRKKNGNNSNALGGHANDSNANSESTYQDVHNRLMARYPEVSEWWYMAVLVTAVAFGLVGIANWETYTSPGVVFYGILLCIVFVVPCGIVYAMTGVPVTLNVLAEFIGGAWSNGNALSMNYFKSYGYVTCAHAINFASDLKLAHYLKVPPRHTFTAQLVATVVSTFVCTGVLNFQMNQIPRVCTEDAPNHYTCPGINTFFTAAVLWGTIGPKKVFGAGGQYTAMLVGFPLGILVPIVFWWVQRTIRKRDEARLADQASAAAAAGADGADGGAANATARVPESTALRWARQAHPIAFLAGTLGLAPYNLSYVWPAVPIAFVSWIWIKNRYLAFWSRYNYVLSASFSSGLAIAAIIIFFALQYNDIELDWWGNNVVAEGCEAKACPLIQLPKGEHFGPGVGEFH
ncbi:Tetrapeptide transporter, OPT1/isp4 [Niveomyces insectorum RCEF 264]|uniref:Tetrapeptide transporter, OPT1/isp4 n=1 Tax=Niveomyces insectorum RCEF 264 TaxID=1081102 RepID=A0A167P5B4_9HYPO|nr:Tetrapeptide transporter, OPT1/isp4 [Niveomyces insectorum RCEF 264]